MKILLVEDDKNLRAGLSDLLTIEGFEPVTAEDGESALDIFASQQPDFCILDIGLPGMDGFDVCRTIRKQNDHVPILFLTARKDEIDHLRGFHLGADDFVEKPFRSSELIARIRAILRRTNASPASTSQNSESFLLHDLRLDVRALRAFRGNEAIDLTQKEMTLLQLFSEHPGEALDRNTIYDKCWGHEHFANSRALDQFIATLRRKIEADPSNPRIIQTVHKTGYRYDPAPSL